MRPLLAAAATRVDASSMHAARLCIAARRVRSTRGLQGQLLRKTQHELVEV